MGYFTDLSTAPSKARTSLDLRELSGYKTGVQSMIPDITVHFPTSFGSISQWLHLWRLKIFSYWFPYDISVCKQKYSARESSFIQLYSRSVRVCVFCVCVPVCVFCVCVPADVSINVWILACVYVSLRERKNKKWSGKVCFFSELKKNTQ